MEIIVNIGVALIAQCRFRNTSLLCKDFRH